MLSEDASQELEALVAILGEDFSPDPDDPAKFVLCIAPEADESESVGALALGVQLPAGYPQTASALITPSSLHQYAERFPHRSTASSANFTPSSEQKAAVKAAIEAAVSALTSDEAVVYEAVSAVREWLEANTLAARPMDVSDDVALAKALEAAEVSEDDLELDSEDVDEEMIEAMREVLDEGDKKILKLLKKAESMPADSKEQRDAIRKAWVSLTPAQRREMVEDSGSEAEEEEDDESEEEAAPAKRPAGRAGGAQSATVASQQSGGKKQAAASASLPPPAQRQCNRGHSLTAIISKPHDYRKLDGNTGNCDLCNADYKYTVGGYHCDTCRNWDCCLKCGSAAPAGGGSGGGGGGKAAQGSKRGKRK